MRKCAVFFDSSYQCTGEATRRNATRRDANMPLSSGGATADGSALYIWDMKCVQCSTRRTRTPYDVLYAGCDRMGWDGGNEYSAAAASHPESRVAAASRLVRPDRVRTGIVHARATEEASGARSYSDVRRHQRHARHYFRIASQPTGSPRWNTYSTRTHSPLFKELDFL